LTLKKSRSSLLLLSLPGSSNGEEDFSNSDVIPISFEDSEIQLAVKNALIQLTEKSAEREEQEKEAEHELSSDSMSSSHVRSSFGLVFFCIIFSTMTVSMTLSSVAVDFLFPLPLLEI
jgi:hypothetical protein